MSRLRVSALRSAGLGPVSLSLEAGSLTCLTGDSGAGKTRLLRCIVDLDLHDGEAWLDGRERSGFAPSEWRRQVGLLPAESQWWLATAAAHLHDPSPDWLAGLGLGEALLARPIAQLSTGERQRLALVRALCNHPAALLLDEPTGHLDGAGARRVEALLETYRRESGAAVLWVSHDPAQVERLGGRHLHMEAGRLREEVPA